MKRAIHRKNVGGRFLPVYVVGGAPFRDIPNPSGAGLIPFGQGLTPMGQGLVPFGQGAQGEGFFEDLDKGFKKSLKKTGQFFTSKPVRQIIRTLRGVSTPLIKKLIPMGIDQLVNASSAIPTIGPAVSVLGQTFKDPIKQGLNSLVDLGNKKAQQAGYGAQFQGYSLDKKDIDSIGKKDIILDKHSIDILDSILGKRGSGLRRL